MSMKCTGSEEAWYICTASLKGESQTAVGALTNENWREAANEWPVHDSCITLGFLVLKFLQYLEKL